MQAGGGNCDGKQRVSNRADSKDSRNNGYNLFGSDNSALRLTFSHSWGFRSSSSAMMIIDADVLKQQVFFSSGAKLWYVALLSGKSSSFDVQPPCLLVRKLVV